MKDQVLSIERMQHLKEFGVDTSKASAALVYRNAYVDIVEWDYVAEYHEPDIGEHNPYIRSEYGTFTLQDILDLIPKNIITNDSHRDNVCFVADFYEKVMGYAYYHETCGEISYYCKFDWFDNIIDAAYEMLLWCSENGYIKTNKDK